MAKYRGVFTEDTIKSRIKDGRGIGYSYGYLPCLTVMGVPSR